MQVKCNIITPAISSLAKEIGKSDAYTCNLVSAWQTEMYKGNIIPTKSQMLDYIKKNQAKVEELKLAIPCYNYEQENGQSKLVRHNGNEITLVKADSKDRQKFLNKLYDNFEATKGTVTNLNEAYRFLLWREQSIIQHGYYDDYRDSDKATNDALAKLRLWKKANPSSQQKQAQTSGPKENKGLPTKNDTINIYAGANENADLSNFANRPFSLISFATYGTQRGVMKLKTDPDTPIDRIRDILLHSNLIGTNNPNPIQVPSVENLFQALKVLYADDKYFEKVGDDEEFRLSKVGKELFLDILNATPAQARSKGKAVEGLYTKTWDNDAPFLMKVAIEQSFFSNPQAAQRLLATGEAKLTHTQDKEHPEWASATPSITSQLIDQLKASGITVLGKTDSSDNTMPEIGTGAEQLLKVDTNTPMAKLAMDINPIQRRARVDMLAHQFSEKLDELVQQKVDELRAELNQEMLGERRPNVLNRIKKQAQLYDNAFEGRKAIMSTAGTSAKEIFDMIKSDLEEAVKDTDSYTPEEIDAYQKTIDNFDLLVNETCAKLESTENVRITFSQNNYHNGKSVSKVVSSNIEDTAQKEEDDEEALNDDDTGKRVEGNAGWSYHARFVDPRTSISKTTKHIIANIPMLDENGEYMVDDLGYQRYMDENYAHNVLLNELSSLISPEDFVTIDEDRNPIAFPALEKATEKYPWIQQVIDVLYEHNDYISAFYADFRKDYIPYWMQYYGKDSLGNWQWFNKQMNAPMALESTLNEIRSDYEHGYRLDQYSVYSVGNKLEVDNANIGLELLNSNKAKDRGALTVLNDPNFDATDAEDEEIDMVINKPTQVFRMLGVNVNKNIITALLGTKDSAEQLKTALNAAKRIFEGIVGGKVAEGADLITAFDEDYKTIAKIVGSVSEIANVGSFRNDDKTYYSYSAPNYMDTMFKKFKSNDRRQQYIDNEFKKYDWFYDKDKEEWYSEWMHILEGDPDDEEFDEECQNIRFNMQMKELKTIKDKTNDPNNRHADYSNWQPMQIKQHFVQEYFSAGTNKSSKTQYAWYNFPIFSDSPVAKFIKFKRYVASKENGSVESQIIPLLRKVVKQELGRMKLVNQRREKGAKPISSFDDDKHLRGTKFCFFPDFEFYYVKEDGTIYDGFGKTKNEIDPSYVSLKDILSELYEAKNTSAANALIDAAVKYDMDDLYTKFLQDFGTVSITEDKGIRLDNDELNKLGKDTLEDLKKSGAISDSIKFSDALHEYFWNQAYATTQIIELTTTDLAFYKDDTDFQKRFKEIYAAGTKLNTLSKYGKKFYKTIYLVDNLITSPSYNDIKKSLDDAVHAHHITAMDRDSILKQLEEINVADAQAYRSLSSIRSVLDMMGQWTPEMETTYNNIRKGDWNMDDLNTIWQTLKPFVYTQIDSSDGIGGRMKVPHQNKNSEFALLYAWVAVATGSSRDGHIQTKTSGKLKAMADFMEKNNIDVIQFQSAVKAGNQGDINLNMSYKKLANWALKKGMTGVVDVNKLEKDFRAEQTDRLKNGEISQSEFDDIIDNMQLDYEETKEILENAAFPNGQEDEEVVHTIPYDDYIIQQPTPEHLLDARAVFGSQFRNLVISDLPEDFKLKIHGKELGKKEILDLYNSLIVENLLDDFDELKKRFKNIEKFQEALLQEVNGNPKYGRDMLDALQLVEVKDENGNTHKEFNIPLYNPATTLKIQELVNSMFKNAITKQHVKGGACILVSSFGFTDELHVLHNPDGSIKGMECYLPAYSKDFFQPFMKTDENGNPYLDPTELPDELRRVIGYRI